MKEFDKDWDWYARLIDGRKESPEWAVIRKARQTHWEEFFDIEPNEKVLDAGCGNGDYTRLVLARGAKVWAFDYSKDMVSSTGARLERAGLKPEKLTLDTVLDIPYPDSTFDVVLCLAVVDHVPDEERSKALSELARVLRPGGKLFINTPNRYAYHWRLGHRLMRAIGLYPKGKVRWFTPKNLQDLVIGAGLQPERSLGLEFLPPFSGLYTSDLKRRTFLPENIIAVLDKWYIALESRLRRIEPFKAVCLHYFLTARKPNVD